VQQANFSGQNAQFQGALVVQPSKTEKYTHLLIDSKGIV
jgi:hypothetical protein